MRRQQAAILAVGLVALASLLAGCGAGGTTANSETAAAVEHSSVHSAPTALGRLKHRMRAAGINGVNIFYAGSEEAKREAAEVLRIVHNHPRQEVAYVHGQIVAWMGNDEGLTGQERADFERLKAIMDSLP